MKYLFDLGVILIIIALISPAHTSITETTDFFKNETKISLYYQTFSGYEDIDWYYPKGSASMYYSLWQQTFSEWSEKEVPLIIWLQGGPGAPSQFGCFNEIGPIYLEGKKGNFMPSENVWAWNFFGHIMCIDQPLGVGFSYNNNSQKINNTADAASQFVNFLTNFFANNPKLGLKQNPLYLAGQSYAGHYIPAFANKILSNTTLGFNLKGILLGDGLVDPISQFNNYDSFLNSAGIISNSWRDTVSFMQNECITRIMQGNYKQASSYSDFIIDDDAIINKYYFGMSVMNYKLYDGGHINTDYGIYLEEKKKIFGVPDWLKYVDDNEQMYKDFADDISRSFKNQLQRVIEANLNVLIYNGQNDVVINTPGVLSYLNSLQWKYAKQWKATPKKVWRFGNQKPIIGWSKKYQNLNFVLVRDAGHLTPADKPRSAYSMLNNYFLNRW